LQQSSIEGDRDGTILVNMGAQLFLVRRSGSGEARVVYDRSQEALLVQVASSGFRRVRILAFCRKTSPRNDINKSIPLESTVATLVTDLSIRRYLAAALNQ
jgi:hypothetical protein